MSVRNQMIRRCISFYDACFLCSFLVYEYITVIFNYLANVSQPTPVLYEYLPSKKLKRKLLWLTSSIPVMNKSVSMSLISSPLLFYWWLQLLLLHYRSFLLSKCFSVIFLCALCLVSPLKCSVASYIANA